MDLSKEHRYSKANNSYVRRPLDGSIIILHEIVYSIVEWSEDRFGNFIELMESIAEVYSKACDTIMQRASNGASKKELPFRADGFLVGLSIDDYTIYLSVEAYEIETAEETEKRNEEVAKNHEKEVSLAKRRSVKDAIAQLEKSGSSDTKELVEALNRYLDTGA